MDVDEKLDFIHKLREALERTRRSIAKAYAPLDVKLPIQITGDDIQEILDEICNANWYLDDARDYANRAREG